MLNFAFSALSGYNKHISFNRLIDKIVFGLKNDGKLKIVKIEVCLLYAGRLVFLNIFSNISSTCAYSSLLKYKLISSSAS
jgi:hypothetical protein